MYQLYTMPGSCSMGIHVLLNSLDIPFEIVPKNEVENYRDLVPTNQVPALQTPHFMLTEGAAIALYLMAEHGDKALTQNPEFLRWLMYCYATLHPAYSKLFSINSMLPEGEVRQQLLQQFADKLANYWQVFSDQLQDRPFFFGDNVTVIDYLIAVYVRWGNTFNATKIPIADNVLELVQRVIALPEFEKALQKESVQYQIPENALAA